ncbi:GNAT family N-acetyltransferase [Rubricoccus marinus]|uniref:BioF2-like acetyltransferase domain-containing protein n=1 Tax=Rubricoccus marinus TaxID=716817 RepID=A0A259U040_9BACT|nr:GNAT family N-acetyltransferase [Rubricoccus marinus]OZC03296.1 hypothetical protein BSZ36_10080 [Rubricoccus marinus]
MRARSGVRPLATAAFSPPAVPPPLAPEAEREAWDTLAGADHPLAESRFADCVERGGVEGARFERLLLRSTSGEPALAAELSRLDVRLDLLSPTPFRGAISRARRLWPRLLRVPVLFAGLPASFAQPGVRLAPEMPESERERLVHALVDRMEAQAETWSTPLLCAKEFTTPEADALAGPLASRGFLRLPSMPGVRLGFEGSSGEGSEGAQPETRPPHTHTPPTTHTAFRAAMRSGYRRQLDADLVARQRLRLRRIENWAPEAEAFYRLYARVMDRAPYQLERFGAGFFHALAERYAGDSAVLVLEDDAGPLAMALTLYGSDTAVFLLAGIDYGRAEPLGAYPALVVSVIEDALARGYSAVELGQTSYALKTRLGGVPTDRWLFLKARTPWAQRLLARAAPALFPRWDVPPRRVFRQSP